MPGQTAVGISILVLFTLAILLSYFISRKYKYINFGTTMASLVLVYMIVYGIICTIDTEIQSREYVVPLTQDSPIDEKKKVIMDLLHEYDNIVIWRATLYGIIIINAASWFLLDVISSYDKFLKQTTVMFITWMFFYGSYFRYHIFGFKMGNLYTAANLI